MIVNGCHTTHYGRPRYIFFGKCQLKIARLQPTNPLEKSENPARFTLYYEKKNLL